jgi:phosphatidylglycerophosphate synthase
MFSPSFMRGSLTCVLVSPVVALLAVAWVALAVLTIVKARRPALAVPDLAGYFDRWQALHGGYDPRAGSVWLRGWLVLAYRVARPLARVGVLPDVLTLWTVWLALAVFVPAQAGGRWPLLGGLVLVLSGLGDTLDGCVAALTDRATRWGYVLDSVVDRLNDVIYLLAVVAIGGAPAVAVVAGVAFFLLEYLRARGANAGAGEVGTVTVGERANRVILTALGLIFAAVFVDHAALVATIALAALAGLSLIGLAQLAVAVRRQLTGS